MFPTFVLRFHYPTHCLCIYPIIVADVRITACCLYNLYLPPPAPCHTCYYLPLFMPHTLGACYFICFHLVAFFTFSPVRAGLHNMPPPTYVFTLFPAIPCLPILPSLATYICCYMPLLSLYHVIPSCDTLFYLIPCLPFLSATTGATLPWCASRALPL